MISCIITASLVSSSTTTSTFYISGGLYPGAPAYTVWAEADGNYYAKDANGLIAFYGTNASDVIINTVLAAYGRETFIAKGTYALTSPIDLSDIPFNIVGEGVNATMIYYSGNCFVVNNTVRLQYGQQSMNNLKIEGISETGIGFYLHNSDRGLYTNLYISNCSIGIKLIDAIGNYFIKPYIKNCTIGVLLTTETTAQYTHNNQFNGGEIQDSRGGNVVINGNCWGNIFQGTVFEGRGQTLVWVQTTHIGPDDYVPAHNEFQYCWFEGVDLNTYLIMENLTAACTPYRFPRATILSNCHFTSAQNYYLQLGDFCRFLGNIIAGGGAGKVANITTAGSDIIMRDTTMQEYVSTIILNNTGYRNTFKNNYGLITENTGTIGFASNTSNTFYHNLASTPTIVLCSFSSSAVDGWTWTATTTQITITVTPSGSYTGYWEATYIP